MGKVLVIFTGGTIESSVANGCISPSENAKRLIINKYKEAARDNNTEIVAVSPYTSLSEYLSARELNLLIDCIFDNINNGYDGIIITHGTDTLQYTASALSFVTQGIDIPIVLVSAAYPLENEKSNGLVNFMGAMAFIKERAGKGVFVAYKNDDYDGVNIHIGTRLIAHQEGLANIYSIDNEPYGVYLNERIVLSKNFKESETAMGTGKIKLVDYPDILLIESRPGEKYDFDIDNKKAIILSPYHSATVNTKEEGLKRLCDKAKELCIPVFLVNAKGGTSYESAQAYSDIGIDVLPFCSKISIYMKCWLGVSMGKDICEFVKKPIAQEFCECENN